MHSSMGSRTHLGVTEPVSLAGPSERHKQITETLISELRANNVFESAADARVREVVLGKLNAIVKDFVYRVSLKRGFHEVQAREAGGKIFTFGSYRLGVHGPGADIDTLAVVPRHVNRDDFFEMLEPTLKARSDVEECIGVPAAWVPVIKMKLSGVEIDLLFASMSGLPTVSDDLDLQDNDLLKGLNEQDMRSVNGSRVTDQILSLVPNVLVFRDALRTIKLWAKRRAIYSNIVGFFGGVVWAMLVARICQLFPNECAGGIISRFFVILHRWDWPTPIMLKRIEEGPLHVKLWNPSIYPGDKAHRMPVITPAYPSMCATHNVSMSTQSVMVQEFKRAADIVDKIVVRSAAWSELFAPHEFFQQYRYYLQITASSIDLDVQLKWSGTVESKIRSLIKNLEFNEQLEMAHPFVDGFERHNVCESTDEMHLVMTGELPRNIYDRKEEDYKNKPETTRVYTTSFFIGLLVRPQDPASGVSRQLNISYPTQEFTKITKQWEGFDEAKMGIVVRYVKAANLPPYVPSVKKAPKAKSLKRQKEDKQAAAEIRQQLPFDSHSNAADGLAGASPAKRIRASSSALEGVNGTSLTPSGSMSSLLGTPAPDTPQTESATRQLQSLTTDPSPLDGMGARDTPPIAIAAGSVPGATSIPSTAALKQAVRVPYLDAKTNGASVQPKSHSNGIPGLTQSLEPSGQSAGV